MPTDGRRAVPAGTLGRVEVRRAAEPRGEAGHRSNSPGSKGSIAAPGQDMVLSTGQTYNVNGWTIESEETRTKFTYDATGKGMYLGIVTLRHF